MQLKILNEKKEPLLSRTMLTASLEYEKATPSYQEVMSLIASQLKTEEKLIAIRHVYNSFGHKKAELIAYIYTDENKKQLIETKIKEKKDKQAKEAKK